MSKERQRARAAREAEQATSRARRQQERARAERQAPRRPSVPKRPPREPVYRARRFPPLPWRLKLALALGWLTAAALTFYVVPTWTGRIGFLVVATFALPLIVVLVHDPSRRTR